MDAAKTVIASFDLASSGGNLCSNLGSIMR